MAKYSKQKIILLSSLLFCGLVFTIFAFFGFIDIILGIVFFTDFFLIILIDYIDAIIQKRILLEEKDELHTQMLIKLTKCIIIIPFTFFTIFIVFYAQFIA